MAAVGRGIAFFKAGGTLDLDSPSYVKRPADEELYHQIQSGQFCYVLTTRQMGKSSLMIRTAGRLRDKGVRVGIVDLSALGTQATIEEWYLGILRRLARSLGLTVDAEAWWHRHGKLGPVQRFTDFVHQVVLAEIEGPIVVFVDEIDSTLKLDFTDDFFAAIRVMYNLRASDPEYDRLTFVLLGVAAPGDLIVDRKRTPFNIGWAIDLQEFSRQEAQPLAEGLEEIYPGQGQRILDQILKWTGGHPYLTQRLCYEIANDAPALSTASLEGDGLEKRINERVERVFLGENGQHEDNLRFVRSSIEASSQRRQLLQLYRQVHTGKVVAEDKRSTLQNRLKLIGLVRARNGLLGVRNEIYRRVFGLSWIKENTATNWAQIMIIGGVALSILAILFAIWFVRWQKGQKLRVQEETFSKGFQNSTSSNVQVHHLAGLCRIDRCERARQLFYEKDSGQQLAMFDRLDAKGAGEKLVAVVDCLYPSIADRVDAPQHAAALSEAMCCALTRLDRTRGEQFSQDHDLDCDCSHNRTPSGGDP